MTAVDALQREADSILWFHTIELGHGVVTRGIGIQAHGAEILPDVRGKTVLDIGAWDGKFSFLAEKAGASRVTALDHYAWGVDFAARNAYWDECARNGTLPDHTRDATEFWQPELPGQRGFRFARETLHSKVEPVVTDFATVDLESLGSFDVTLYLGVLYHMKEPITCLERVRAVTKEVAVIETEAIHIENLDDSSLLQLHAGGSLRNDFGNWFVPTIEGLHDLCVVAGFSKVETIQGPPPPVARSREPRRAGLLGRATHGRERPDEVLRSADTQHYRAIVHAYV